MKQIKILLGETEFKALVSGQVIDVPKGELMVKIALQDIGWDNGGRSTSNGIRYPGSDAGKFK